MRKGEMIRPLTPEEKELRDKYTRIVLEREQAVKRAIASHGEAQAFLNDLALAFHGGGGPVVMASDGLYRPAPTEPADG